MSGTLFIVATPIGNLEDLTVRARQTLAEVDLIAAEDTRHTGRLLSGIGVKRPLMSLHDHNEAQAADSAIEALRGGRNIALVSDAGTPLISDPGYRLVAAAHDAGIRVTPIPGPSALTAALSVSGLATDRFCFEGFLPSRPAARRAALSALRQEPRSMVFYESVHRIEGFLGDAAAVFGAARPAFLGRELTKLHEQCVAASLGSLKQQIESGSIVNKGEFVIVVAGTGDAERTPAIDTDLLLRELSAELPARRAATLASKLTGIRPNALYARLLELADNTG